MIKSHKQEMLSLLNTMGKMAGLLPKLADPFEQIQDCLAACLCLMENLEGENAPKSLNLLRTIETSLKENKLNILEHIKKLEPLFNSEIKANREALFLPYKASMWDSLESIYLAAKDDPGWDAFVMPIPYYDKKDGKLTEKHWEIDYPKGIPLIDYKKYNIEERHPDIIFIHNPYDGCNIVTSVEPDFYSEKLRNLTGCLVYVPYFVGDGTRMDEHFCTLPACIFAHKVIVQTEEERKHYIKAYKEFAKRNRVPERFEQIEGKFLALGSPKLDKAIAAKRGDCEIPPEWEGLINDRKVVFYNLSIGSLLENTIEDGKPSGKYFQKVRGVFEFFKKQSDFVLLWRPHPLLESTIKSMRPWLEREYAEIVKEYKAGGYGIYDDTADLNRAIALSDMYYGDGSSVAKLFEAAGKPVLGQVFEVPYFHGILNDDNFGWSVDYLNMLYRHNKRSKETECMGAIPAQNHWAYLGIAANNGDLYFAPYYKNSKISIFNADRNKFEQISFKDNCKYEKNFRSIASFKNFVYFIPFEFPAIMRLNTDTKEIEYFSECIDEIFKQSIYKLQETWKSIFWGFCIADEEIAIIINGLNALMFFNMETGNYEIKNVGEKFERYYGICFDGQDYYLSSFYKGYIVKWNRQSNNVSKIKIPSFSRKESISPSFLIQYSNGHVWLIPICANNAYKININTNEIMELPEFTEHFKDKNLRFCYNCVCINENAIYTATQKKGIAEYRPDVSELNFFKFDFEIDPWLLAWLYDHDNWKSKYCKPLEATEFAGKKIWGHFK